VRYTVPWLPPPPTRGPRDDDEIGGNTIALARFVGTFVRRRRSAAVTPETLAIALWGLFGRVLDVEALTRDEIVTCMSAPILLASTLGLVTVDDAGNVVATDAPLPDVFGGLS
jgi:hypothetical protein